MSKYVSEHPGGDCIGFYKVPPRWEHNGALAALLWGPWYFSNNLPSMCLSLLDQVVWRRRSEEEGKKESCQAACEEPANPEGLLALSGRVFLCVCMKTQVAAEQLYKHELWSDLHRHTHKTFNCQKKKSLSRAPLCLMCSTLILPFGDICCCVNYTPPGALINTHTNMRIHQHTHKHKHTMYTILVE